MKSSNRFHGLVLLLAGLSETLVSAPVFQPAAGACHVVALDGGTVLGLGDRTFGQLGSPTPGSPHRIPALGGVTQVAAGQFSTIGLKSDGTVWFLGDFTVQHVTAHGTPNAVTTPTQVAGLSQIVRITAGARHFLALDSSGNVHAWGHNANGQIGNDHNQDRSSPVVVLNGVRDFAAGNGYSVAVKLNGEVWTWGRNHHGQLGHGDTLERRVPTKVTGIANTVACAAGASHTLILQTDGSVLACGSNDFGQLGTGSTTAVLTPVTIPIPAPVTALAAGANHSTALASTGAVYLWGRNHEGQCGGGATSAVTILTPTATPLPGFARKIACGWNFTLFELANQTLWGCGSNSDGQLGGTSVANEISSPKVFEPQLILTFSDSDHDGLSDSLEGDADTDGDGIVNSSDPDSDGDGVPDSDEGTTDRDDDGTSDYVDPFTDGDHDKMDDNWELFHFSSLVRDGRGDFDSDGLADFFESMSGANPADPSSVRAVMACDGWMGSPAPMARLSMKVRIPLVLGMDFNLETSGTLLDWTRMTTNHYQILSTVPDGNTSSILEIGVPPSVNGSFFRLAR